MPRAKGRKVVTQPTEAETQEAATEAHAPEMQDTAVEFDTARLDAMPPNPSSNSPEPSSNGHETSSSHGVSVAGADQERGFSRQEPERRRRTFDPKSGRPWTERYEQPVKYRRFTTRDESGQDVIMFRFDLAPGEDKPPPEVLEVMHKHQRDLNDEPTGLKYNPVDRRHGKVWKLPNDPQGGTTADRIDRDLQEVAEKLAGREAGR